VLGRGGRAIASLRLWLPEPREATEWELRVAEFGAHAAGIVLERERAAAALHEGDLRFRIAADAARAAVYDVDVAAGGEGSAVAYGLEHIVGMPTRDRISSEWWRSRVHPEDAAEHDAVVARSIRDADCTRYERESDGLSHEASQTAARRRFGNARRLREESVESWGWSSRAIAGWCGTSRSTASA
jgi:hypothetical protein